MEIVIAPDNDVYENNFSVFLAGAIDMGKAVDWQSEVIQCLTNLPHLSIYNPRRLQPFAMDMLDEQIKWELDHLDAADCIFMWFPRESLAPISFFEAGLFWKSGKLIVGAEQGFYRRRNLELSMTHYLYNGESYLYDNLSDMIHELENCYNLWNA